MNTVKAMYFQILWSTNSLFGAGSMIGMDLADPSNKQLLQDYSDIVIDAGHKDGYHYIDPLYPDDPYWVGQGLTDKLAINQVEDLWYFLGTTDKETADKLNREYNLFGLPYLEWDKVALEDTNGDYAFSHQYGKDGKQLFNPIRREVLMGKVKTVAILAGAGVGTYYGGKFALKKLNRYL